MYLWKPSDYNHAQYQNHFSTHKQPMCCLPVALKHVVNTEVEKNMKDNIIRPSKSVWSSPVVLIRKKTNLGYFDVNFGLIQLQ